MKIRHAGHFGFVVPDGTQFPFSNTSEFESFAVMERSFDTALINGYKLGRCMPIDSQGHMRPMIVDDVLKTHGNDRSTMLKNKIAVIDNKRTDMEFL